MTNWQKFKRAFSEHPEMFFTGVLMGGGFVIGYDHGGIGTAFIVAALMSLVGALVLLAKWAGK